MFRNIAVIAFSSIFALPAFAENKPIQDDDDAKKFLDTTISSPIEGIKTIDTNTDKRRIDFGTISQPGKLEQKLNEYVDLRFQKRKHCLDRPARPAWAIRMPKEYANFGDIAQVMYDLKRHQAATDITVCSCDIVYPSWDEVYLEFQDLISNTPPGTLHYDTLKSYQRMERKAEETSDYSSVCNAAARRALP